MIRTGHEVSIGQKHIGILNVESVNVDAFSALDETFLMILARVAALAFDGIETDRKYATLDQTKRNILRGTSFEQTIQAVLAVITDTLDYEFVSISLVDHDSGRIPSCVRMSPVESAYKA